MRRRVSPRALTATGSGGKEAVRGTAALPRTFVEVRAPEDLLRPSNFPLFEPMAPFSVVWLSKLPAIVKFNCLTLPSRSPTCCFARPLISQQCSQKVLHGMPAAAIPPRRQQEQKDGRESATAGARRGTRQRHGTSESNTAVGGEMVVDELRKEAV